jgi:hypothetical protein
MNKGEKKTTQKILFIIANGRFNNRKNTLEGLVTKEKKSYET